MALLFLVLRSSLFSGLTLSAGHHAFEPAADDGFGVTHDARYQLGAGWDIMNKSLHLSGRPDALVGVTGRIDHLAAGAGDEFAHVLEFRAFLLHRDHLGRDRILG